MDPGRLRRRAGELSRLAARVALLLALASGAAPATAAVVEFLYVEANVGTAAGGHAALRLGERIFHYQNVAGDRLRLVREDFDFFRYRYSVLENRTIHVSRIAVTDATRERLDEHFDSRFQIEAAHFDALAGRRGDVALLEQLRSGRTGRQAGPPLEFAGGGFFPAPGGTGDGLEPSMAALRARIERAHGERFLADRAQRVLRELAQLEPGASAGTNASALELSRERLPAPEYTFSQRVADLAAQQHALTTLGEARPLAGRWRRAAPDPELSLGRAERAALAAFASRLETNLTALVASRRPDWGYPLLFGMARLVVIEESLRTGRLVVLDAFPKESRSLAGDAPQRVRFFGELRDYARGELSTARSSMQAASPAGEREYSDLEDA